MRISVVIPTVNESTLRHTLDALARQTSVPDEILVVGCDANDITRNRPRVRFFDTGAVVCAAAARNIGIKSAIGDVIAFTDADCIPHADWLHQHLQAQRAGFEIVGGGVVPAGANFWAQADNISMFHDYLMDHDAGSRQLLPTLNLSVRRGVINAIGYMDESFPGAAAEDSDWTIRMRIAGYTLHFDPGALVSHAPARTAWRDVVRHWRKLGYSAVRNRLRHAQTFGTPALVRVAWLWWALSPMIAIWVTLRIYANPIMWRYLKYLPVVCITRVIYCFGAAASIRSGYAFDGTRKFPKI